MRRTLLAFKGEVFFSIGFQFFYLHFRVVEFLAAYGKAFLGAFIAFNQAFKRRLSILQIFENFFQFF